jgi:predicted  nucleic acid-binding Zn-ribbon protein
MGDRSELEALAREYEAQRGLITGLILQQRSQSLEAESVRARVTEMESRLYGGTITNLREMEGYQKEASFLQDQLRELDDRVLATMLSLEETQQRVQSLEERARGAEGRWEAEQKALGEELKRLGDALASLEQRRLDLVPRISQQDMKLYDELRAAKGGRAIARVERGMCRGCSMALPTHQLQRARAGKEPVRCNSCGRILFVG